jgi:hypothetical protein
MLGNIRLARSRTILRSVSIFTAAAALLTAICSAEAATYQVIYNFASGSSSSGGPLVGPDGALYGAGSGGANGTGFVFKLTPPAPGQQGWTFSDLYDFPTTRPPAPIPPAIDPQGPLVMDSTGALYGVTQNAIGGAAGIPGRIFKLTPPASGNTAWTISYPYTLPNGNDGVPRVPHAGLAIDRNDVIYGTTWTTFGVSSELWQPGTAFKITPPGPGQSAAQVSTYVFPYGPTPGVISPGQQIEPQGRPYVDASGRLYGTLSGPAFDVGYRLIPPAPGSSDWTADFVGFPGGILGAKPNGGIIADANGALYGTMKTGGEGSSGDLNNTGCGTIYQVTLAPQGGWGDAALMFTCGWGGEVPQGGLVMNANGSIFGAVLGGVSDGRSSLSSDTSGILFELDQPYGYGTLSAVHYFTGSAIAGVATVDGAQPNGDLAIDKNGNIYGTTQRGGVNAGGVVYMLTP